MAKFEEIKIGEWKFNPFDLKSKWMLITAEKEGKVNMMTASWGGCGIMWNKEVVFVVIRPTRYTKEFVDYASTFSLCFFDDPSSKKKYLNYLGTVSGRDEDKIKKTGLTVLHEGPTPFFEEADTVFIVKKLYAQPLKEEFFMKDFFEGEVVPKNWYPEKDYHTLYFAEIEKVLKKR